MGVGAWVGGVGFGVDLGVWVDCCSCFLTFYFPLFFGAVYGLVLSAFDMSSLVISCKFMPWCIALILSRLCRSSLIYSIFIV